MFGENELDNIKKNKSYLLKRQLNADTKAAVDAFAKEVQVIIHTASNPTIKCEMWAVLADMDPPQLSGSLSVDKPVDLCIMIGPQIFVGMFGGVKAALVQTDMGSACGNEIEIALEKLEKVENILAVGIAYGKSKYNIGDVLVANQIDGVENIRLGENKDIIFKYTDLRNVPVTPFLRFMFVRNAQMWNITEPFRLCKDDANAISTAYSGLVISSPTLLANSDAVREFLHNSRDQAIGGEMEGCELLKVRERFRKKGQRQIGVIIIKAIADFGDGDKEIMRKWQFTTARAAVSFTKFSMIYNGYSKLIHNSYNVINTSCTTNNGFNSTVALVAHI